MYFVLLMSVCIILKTFMVFMLLRLFCKFLELNWYVTMKMVPYVHDSFISPY